MSKSVLGKSLGALLDQEKKPIGVHGLSGTPPGTAKPEISSSKGAADGTLKSHAAPMFPLSLVSLILFSIDLFVCAVSWLLYAHSDLQHVAKIFLLVTGFSLGAAAASLGVWLLNKRATVD